MKYIAQKEFALHSGHLSHRTKLKIVMYAAHPKLCLLHSLMCYKYYNNWNSSLHWHEDVAYFKVADITSIGSIEAAAAIVILSMMIAGMEGIIPSYTLS